MIVTACLAAAPAMAAAPTATTGDGAAGGANTAHLTGFVERNGEDTTYYFQYGTSTSYGQETQHLVLDASAPVGGCSGCNPVSADLSGLAPATTYHFRLVAVNASGPSEGLDRTVTTGAASQPPPPSDRDGDGTPDSSDNCPDVPGPASYGGCPPPTDSDADGIPDSMDACPTVYGPPAGSNNANGCPPPPAQNTTEPGPSPEDLDGDGVLNAADKCPNSGGDTVDANGCGPFEGRVIFGARSTLEIQDDPGIYAQCRNHAGKPCTFHLTMKLSAASAKRLGIARKLFDVSLKATKSSAGGSVIYGSRDMRFSRKVEKAFKHAYAERIPVTMTFDGTMTYGTKVYAFQQSTFTMRRKPPGGSAYRVEPFLAQGDKGPVSGGLTRKADPNDF